MSAKKRNTEAISSLEKFFDLVDQALLVFQEGVKSYLHRDMNAITDNIQSIVKLENESVTLERQIEASLYRRSGFTSMRGDILRLMERIEHIVSTLNNDLFQFEIERPNIPSELNPDFFKLLELSSQAVANTVPACKAYFHSMDTVPDKVRRVYFYQKETDRQAKALKRKVFHEMNNLKLSEKVHLRYFALHIEQLSIAAAKVADQLSVMALRASSPAGNTRFANAVHLTLSSMMLLASVILVIANASAVNGANRFLICVAAILAVVFLSAMAVFLLRARRNNRRSDERIVAQEDEINEGNRKLSEMEVQIMKMENDHLQNLLDLKRKETTGAVEKITEQKEFIDNIYEMLHQAEYAQDGETRDRLLHDAKAQLSLRRNQTPEQEDFYAKVEQLHKDFSARLSAKFPTLTAQERKLATLLRLEFNTKYIASVLNISSKSVEVERHRLRRKMGLVRNQNLTEFVKSI